MEISDGSMKGNKEDTRVRGETSRPDGNPGNLAGKRVSPSLTPVVPGRDKL